MEKEITLTAKDFTNFLRCLSSVKDICNDVDIKGGVLRQRSNDKTAIIEMNLTPLISDSDISIRNVDGKLPNLKGLSKQNVQITITEDETYFSGKRSTFSFKNPNLDFMDNKFMSSEEFFNIFTLREEDLVLEYLITKEISDLIKATSQQFKIVSFQIFFHGNVASITTSSKSKDEHFEIESGIPLKKPLDGFSNIVVKPFLLNHDRGMFFKMYNIEETIFINKFTASLGEVATDVYCRSQLIKEEEDSTLPREEGMNQGDGMDKQEGILTEEGKEEKADDAK